MKATNGIVAPAIVRGTTAATLLDGIRGFILGGITAMTVMVSFVVKGPRRLPSVQSQRGEGAVENRLAASVPIVRSFRTALSSGRRKSAGLAQRMVRQHTDI
jgi:hypothetical protein